MPNQLRFRMLAVVALVLSPVTPTGWGSEVESNTRTDSQRYVVPEGDVSMLVEFIRQLSQYRPSTAEQDIEHRCKFLPALKQAAEKIVGLESDTSSPAYEAAEFVLLSDRIHSLAQTVREEQDETVADVTAYVAERIKKGQCEVATMLAQLAAKTCQATGQYDLAAEAYRRLGEVLEGCDDRSTANEGAKMRAHAERLLATSRTVPRVPDAPEIPAGNKLVPLDIQLVGNASLEGSGGSGQFAGNGLAELRKGEQTLCGVRFQIGDKIIRTDAAKERDGVLKVQGIPVDRRFARLFALHATGKGSPHFVDGTKIGSYTIRYEDGSEKSIPIVYGEDVRDWWDFDEGMPVTRGRVVWTGRNLAADKYEVTLRLYLGVWENPHPERTVTSIEYITSTRTECRPFCVAMTIEAAGDE